MGLLFPLALVQGFEQPKFSTAGFYRLPDSGRDVYSMNVAWRFHKGTSKEGLTASHSTTRNGNVSPCLTALSIYRRKRAVASIIKAWYGIANTSLRKRG